jgi:hypothetical protein
MNTEEFRNYLKEELIYASTAIGGDGSDGRRCEKFAAQLDKCSSSALASAAEVFTRNNFQKEDFYPILGGALYNVKSISAFLASLEKDMKAKEAILQGKEIGLEQFAVGKTP